MLVCRLHHLAHALAYVGTEDDEHTGNQWGFGSRLL